MIWTQDILVEALAHVKSYSTSSLKHFWSGGKQASDYTLSDIGTDHKLSQYLDLLKYVDRPKATTLNNSMWTKSVSIINIPLQWGNGGPNDKKVKSHTWH